MDSDQVRISFSVEPAQCILRRQGFLGVASAKELRQTALEVAAYQKDVLVDWSGAAQLDASVAQILLLALRAHLAGQNLSLASGTTVPLSIQNWLGNAGLLGVLGSPGQGA